MSVVSAGVRDVAAKTGEWREDPGFGVYVHIPFCRHRCHYCDFNTYEGLESVYEDYVSALVEHIGSLQGTFPPATSVFFGGGTPTILAPADLGRVLRAVHARVGIAPGAEVTVEANPETVDEARFEALLGHGFNRVSIGVQSLVPRVLAGLGRTHSPETALGALSSARRAGFEDINADLIYGSSWEEPQDWRTSLEGVIETGPDHISAYALTVEEGTPLGTWVNTGRIPDVDPDAQADRYEVARELLETAGYRRYEVSNWARRGRASAHNVLYWSAGDYLGVGAGAHGHIAGRRYWSQRLPRRFIEAVHNDAAVEAGAEVLESEQRASEGLMLGLRLTSGVDTVAFERRFGASSLSRRGRAIRELIADGMLERRGALLRVPAAELFRLDAVLTRLLA